MRMEYQSMKKWIAMAAFAALGYCPALAEGDVAKGQDYFRKCAACHTIGDGARSRAGPNLFGLYGRPVGSLEDFRFSAIYKQARDAGDVWTEEKFIAFIENPRAMYDSGRMTMRVPDAQDRADLAAFLATKSAGAPKGP